MSYVTKEIARARRALPATASALCLLLAGCGANAYEREPKGGRTISITKEKKATTASSPNVNYPQAFNPIPEIQALKEGTTEYRDGLRIQRFAVKGVKMNLQLWGVIWFCSTDHNLVRENVAQYLYFYQDHGAQKDHWQNVSVQDVFTADYLCKGDQLGAKIIPRIVTMPPSLGE